MPKALIGGLPFAALLIVTMVTTAALAQTPGVENPQRARVNYMLQCQGCHGAEGAGTADGAVPAMKDFVGNFLKLPQGREFLVRVPGSANSAMSDAELAEVLNWMLPRMSAAQMPEEFEPYSALEVARWRAEPLLDVAGFRAGLIEQLGTAPETP